MGKQEIVREAMAALLEAAKETGHQQRLKLGRELTEAEAADLAAMVARQFQTALALIH